MVLLILSLRRAGHSSELLSADGYISTPIDLSKATRLQKAEFRCGFLIIGWIITALQSITSEHQDLRGISIDIPFPATFRKNSAIIVLVEERGRPGMRWSDLDRLLVGFWESRSIRPKVMCPQPRTEDEGRVGDLAEYLLPELTKRGIMDVVEVPSVFD